MFFLDQILLLKKLRWKSITPEIQERLEEEEKDNIKEIILNQYIDQQ